MEEELCQDNRGEVYVCESDFTCENLYVNDACVIQNDKINIENEEQGEYVPCTVMQTQYVQGKEMEKPMVILFDPGSTRSYIRKQILPEGTTPSIHRKELLASDDVKRRVENNHTSWNNKNI